MALFDRPRIDYPTRWADYSLDYKLMFGYHVSMMAMFLVSRSLSVNQEILATLLLIAILSSLSMQRRREMNWHWEGAPGASILLATVGFLAGSIFFFAATPLFPPWNSMFLPWYLGGLGILAFGLFNSLGLVQLSEAEYLKRCETRRDIDLPAQPAPVDPLWKRAMRGCFFVGALLIYLEFAAFLYYYGTAYRSGSPVPTLTQTKPLNEHGSIFFVTEAQKQEIDFLRSTWVSSMIAIFLCAFIAHFLLDVKLAPNIPTLKELRARPAAN